MSNVTASAVIATSTCVPSTLTWRLAVRPVSAVLTTGVANFSVAQPMMPPNAVLRSSRSTIAPGCRRARCRGREVDVRARELHVERAAVADADREHAGHRDVVGEHRDVAAAVEARDRVVEVDADREVVELDVEEDAARHRGQRDDRVLLRQLRDRRHPVEAVGAVGRAGAVDRVVRRDHRLQVGRVEERAGAAADASNVCADNVAVIACGTPFAIGAIGPATTARVSWPGLPESSVAIAWSRFVPGVTGTFTEKVPSDATVVATPLTVTVVTALSSVAVPVTVTCWTSPAIVPRVGAVMWTTGAFGS